METTEKSTEQAASPTYIDLDNILKGLDSLSNCMDQLALRTELRKCDLIVCIGHPDKVGVSESPRGTEAAATAPQCDLKLIREEQRKRIYERLVRGST